LLAELVCEAHTFGSIGAGFTRAEALANFDRQFISAAIKHWGSMRRSARELGMSRASLYRLCDVRGIRYRELMGQHG